jgi:hypothetical protein
LASVLDEELTVVGFNLVRCGRVRPDMLYVRNDLHTSHAQMSTGEVEVLVFHIRGLDMSIATMCRPLLVL